MSRDFAVKSGLETELGTEPGREKEDGRKHSGAESDGDVHQETTEDPEYPVSAPSISDCLADTIDAIPHEESHDLLIQVITELSGSTGADSHAGSELDMPDRLPTDGLRRGIAAEERRMGRASELGTELGREKEDGRKHSGAESDGDVHQETTEDPEYPVSAPSISDCLALASDAMPHERPGEQLETLEWDMPDPLLMDVSSQLRIDSEEFSMERASPFSNGPGLSPRLELLEDRFESIRMDMAEEEMEDDVVVVDGFGKLRSQVVSTRNQDNAYSIVGHDGAGADQLCYKEGHFHARVGEMLQSLPSPLSLPRDQMLYRLPFTRYHPPPAIQVCSVRGYKIKLITEGRHPGLVRLWRMVLPRLTIGTWRIVEEVFGPLNPKSEEEKRVLLSRVKTAISQLPGLQEIRLEWLTRLRTFACDSSRRYKRDEATSMLETHLMTLTKRIRSSRDHAAMLIVPLVNGVIDIPPPFRFDAREASQESAAEEPVDVKTQVGLQPQAVQDHTRKRAATEVDSSHEAANEMEKKKRKSVVLQSNTLSSLRFTDDSFERLDVAGRGSFGTVWRAVEAGTSGQPYYAIKEMKMKDANWTRQKRIQAVFETEVRNLRRAQHENVVHLIDYYISDEAYDPRMAIVTLFAPLGSLDDVMSAGEDMYLELHPLDMRWKPLRNLLTLDVRCYLLSKALKDVAFGLEYVHSLDIIHRDVKPQNILIFPTFTAKLSDFGVSMNVLQSTSSHPPGVGTLMYMAPEVHEGSYSFSVDLWSFGIVLHEASYRMLTELSWAGEGRRERVPSRRAPLPTRVKFLEAIRNKCLRECPEDRYETRGSGFKLSDELAAWTKFVTIGEAKLEVVSRFLQAYNRVDLTTGTNDPIDMSLVAAFEELKAKDANTSRPKAELEVFEKEVNAHTELPRKSASAETRIEAHPILPKAKQEVFETGVNSSSEVTTKWKRSALVETNVARATAFALRLLNIVAQNDGAFPFEEYEDVVGAITSFEHTVKNLDDNVIHLIMPDLKEIYRSLVHEPLPPSVSEYWTPEIVKRVYKWYRILCTETDPSMEKAENIIRELNRCLRLYKSTPRHVAQQMLLLRKDLRSTLKGHHPGTACVWDEKIDVASGDDTGDEECSCRDIWRRLEDQRHVEGDVASMGKLFSLLDDSLDYAVKRERQLRCDHYYGCGAVMGMQRGDPPSEGTGNKDRAQRDAGREDGSIRGDVVSADLDEGVNEVNDRRVKNPGQGSHLDGRAETDETAPVCGNPGLVDLWMRSICLSLLRDVKDVESSEFDGCAFEALIVVANYHGLKLRNTDPHQGVQQGIEGSREVVDGYWLVFDAVHQALGNPNLPGVLRGPLQKDEKKLRMYQENSAAPKYCSHSMLRAVALFWGKDVYVLNGCSFLGASSAGKQLPSGPLFNIYYHNVDTSKMTYDHEEKGTHVTCVHEEKGKHERTLRSCSRKSDQGRKRDSLHEALSSKEAIILMQTRRQELQSDNSEKRVNHLQPCVPISVFQEDAVEIIFYGLFKSLRNRRRERWKWRERDELPVSGVFLKLWKKLVSEGSYSESVATNLTVFAALFWLPLTKSHSLLFLCDAVNRYGLTSAKLPIDVRHFVFHQLSKWLRCKLPPVTSQNLENQGELCNLTFDSLLKLKREGARGWVYESFLSEVYQSAGQDGGGIGATHTQGGRRQRGALVRMGGGRTGQRGDDEYNALKSLLERLKTEAGVDLPEDFFKLLGVKKTEHLHLITNDDLKEINIPPITRKLVLRFVQQTMPPMQGVGSGYGLRTAELSLDQSGAPSPYLSAPQQQGQTPI